MTHAVRTRIRNFCLAVLPAGIVFSSLLLCPLGGFSQTPSFPRTPRLRLQSTIFRWFCMGI